MEQVDDSFFKLASIDVIKSKNESGETETVWRGVLSSTGVDYDDERLTRKALVAASKQLVGKTVFFNHKHDGLGVGYFKAADVEDLDSGVSNLVVEVIPSKAPGVQDVVIQVNEGTLKCMSIGGKKLTKGKMVMDKSLNKEVMELDDILALEGSIVGIGANPDANLFGLAKSMFIKSQYASSDDGTDVGTSGKEAPADKEPIVAPKKKKTKDGKEVEDSEKSLGDAEMTEEPKVEVEKDARLTGSGAQAPAPNNPPLVAGGEGIEGAKKCLMEALRMLGNASTPMDQPSYGTVKSVSEDDKMQKILDKLESISPGKQGLVAKEAKFDSAPEKVLPKTNQLVNASAIEVFKRTIKID